MTGRDRMIIVVIAMAALLGGMWFMVVSPRRDQAHRLDQQVAQARSDRDQAYKTFQAAKIAIKDEHSASADLARLGQSVPPDDQTASLVYQLQNAAGHSHVSFDSVIVSGNGSAPAGGASATSAATAAPLPPGAVPGPAGLAKVPFTLTFVGTYFGLEHFLNRVYAFTTVRGKVIRVHGRLLQIDGVSLKAAQSGFPHIEADLTASAYIAPPAAATPPATSTTTPAGAAPAPGASASTAPPVAPAAITGAGR